MGKKTFTVTIKRFWMRESLMKFCTVLEAGKNDDKINILDVVVETSMIF
jgi:hypothetical protein